MKKAALLLLGGLLTTVPAAGQQHDHGAPAAGSDARKTQSPPEQSMGAEHECMQPLDLRTSLGLSEDQIARLEKIRARSTEQQAQHSERSTAEERSAAAALAAEPPDLAAYEAHLRAAADEQVALRLVAARARQEESAVLTTGQRDQLRSATAMMHEMMEAMKRKEEHGAH